jgi:3-oxoacyl-[acyl-carrier protein] reductase
MKKNILIVGGSSGIGLEIVKQLHEEHNVYVANRTNESLSNFKHQFIKIDITEETIDSSILPESLDGLVYCPGTINLRPFRGLKPETFISDFNINVMGAIRNIQAVLKNLNQSEISVNAIAPSITNTPLADKFLNNEAKMERAIDRHPLKKIGSPKELANTAIFLLKNSSWITGQIISVDGGIGTLKV